MRKKTLLSLFFVLCFAKSGLANFNDPGHCAQNTCYACQSCDPTCWSPCCTPCGVPCFYGNAYVEYLYWRVRQGQALYAFSPNMNISPAAQATLASQSLGRYEFAELEWHSGVRVGASFGYSTIPWMLFTGYTYYSSEGNDTVTRPADPSQVIFAAMLAITGTGVQEARSHIEFNYHVADLLLMRDFYLFCDQIDLQVGFGAVGAWINQDWNVDYLDASTTLQTLKWNFRGGGIKMGFDGLWQIWKCFSIFSKAYFATLLGNLYNKTFSFYTPAGTVFFDPVRDTTGSETVVIPTTQFALGIDWTGFFKNWCWHLVLSAEVNTWYHLQKVYRDMRSPSGFLNDRPDTIDVENVHLYGLTARFQVNF